MLCPERPAPEPVPDSELFDWSDDSDSLVTPAPEPAPAGARSDILDPTIYAQVRKSVRATMIEVKQKRRMAVGPNATLHFECYDTMHYQIQEMLHAERGGEAQIEDELRAYAPLIPQGNELVATFMLEFTDPVIRARQLARLGGIRVALRVDGPALHLEVEDDGPGVPEGSRPHLFEPYFSTKQRGTGLGLAIVRRIAEDHGGEASYWPLEPGSRFSLLLPLRDPA